MLAILATHPIQYHVPLWQRLARDGQIPFEVWYLSQHATQLSRDREFGREFAWDLEMLEGYPHRFLQTPPGSTPNTPFRLRVAESLPDLFRQTKARVLWVQGWQVAAYWQAVWAAHKAGIQVWLRGESNVLREQGAGAQGACSKGALKRTAKRILLKQLFTRVDHFLCIGTANRDLYRSYGVPESKLHMAPYAVDNERFAAQANQIRNSKLEIKKGWGISDAEQALLAALEKKRPLDVIKAARLLLESGRMPNIHLLFVGSGELGAEIRAACSVVFDAEAPSSGLPAPSTGNPRASFAGFLNQTEISKAYVTSDVLVLPSDYSETWGLVVNEAMASGVPCIISDRCGCARDLGKCAGNMVFTCGDPIALANHIAAESAEPRIASQPPSFQETVSAVRELYSRA